LTNGGGQNQGFKFPNFLRGKWDGSKKVHTTHRMKNLKKEKGGGEVVGNTVSCNRKKVSMGRKRSA